MRDLTFTSEDAYKKRLTYFKVIYFLTLAVSLLYIIKFNFQYKVPDYNSALIPIWVVLLIVPQVCLRLLKNYLISACIMGTMSSLILAYLLYLSGGVEAPGIFWLTAIPLVCGMLVGVPGAIGGQLAPLVILGVFLYARAVACARHVIT